LSQKPKEDQPGFDVATVILNADATKVYTSAVSLLRRNQTLYVVVKDQETGRSNSATAHVLFC
jgi:hypothetical protein